MEAKSDKETKNIPKKSAVSTKKNSPAKVKEQEDDMDKGFEEKETKPLKKSPAKKTKEEDEDDDIDFDEQEEDGWNKDDDEDNWDPDFDEFDIPKSKSKSGAAKKSLDGKKKGKDEEDDDLKFDDGFNDMDLYDDNFDEEEDF